MISFFKAIESVSSLLKALAFVYHPPGPPTSDLFKILVSYTLGQWRCWLYRICCYSGSWVSSL